jgi:hypothetical protein
MPFFVCRQGMTGSVRHKQQKRQGYVSGAGQGFRNLEAMRGKRRSVGANQ